MNVGRAIVLLLSFFVWAVMIFCSNVNLPDEVALPIVLHSWLLLMILFSLSIKSHK